jgi:hypothetical protein
MTQAPLAVVAALRETSILFGALLAFLMLKEKVAGLRIVAPVASLRVRSYCACPDHTGNKVATNCLQILPGGGHSFCPHLVSHLLW